MWLKAKTPIKIAPGKTVQPGGPAFELPDIDALELIDLDATEEDSDADAKAAAAATKTAAKK